MTRSDRQTIRRALAMAGVLAFIAAFTAAPRPLPAQDTAGLRLEPAAESALQEALARPLRKFPLNQKGADEIAAAIQAWVGNFMDLGAAKPRPSRLYAGGVTYHLQAAKNVPIFCEGGAKGESGAPAEIFFRRSPHRLYFHKFTTVASATKLDDGVLIDQASRFLQANGFVRFSEADRWGDMTVRTVTTEGEGGEDAPPSRVFELQRVKFRRYYDGLPVADSAISVDFSPLTGEVLGLSHSHWTPVDEAFGADVPKPAMEDLRKSLVGKIRGNGIGLERARVEKIRACWFETLGGLVPALMCELVIDPPAGEEVQPARIVEYINLAGSDDELRLKNAREIQGPPAAPPAEVEEKGE